MSLIESKDLDILSRLKLICLRNSKALCRCCLEIIDTIPQNLEINTWKYFYELTGISDITIEDFPLSLCMNCLIFISTTHSFKNQCKRIDIILRQANFKADTISDKNDAPKEITGSIISTNENSSANMQNCNIVENKSDDNSLPNENVDEFSHYADEDTTISFINTSQLDANNRENAHKEFLSLKWKDFKSYNCKICGKVFDNKQSKSLHKIIHSGGDFKKYSAVKSSIQNLSNRLMTSSLNKAFKCRQCNKSFVKRDVLKAHERTHSGKKLYVCDQCGRGFVQRGSLIVHFRIHTGQRPYICHSCPRTFTDASSLRVHSKRHAGVKEAMCSICGKQMWHTGVLNKHMRTHTGERPYKCKLCDKAFANNQSLKEHMPKHTGEKNYICTVCGEKFEHSTKLRWHLKSHSDNRLKCNLCPKTFCGPSALKQHFKLHAEKDTYSCLQCNRTFSKSKHLAKHMQYHSGERPYLCPECGHAFTLPKTLRNHVKIHSSDDKNVVK